MLTPAQPILACSVLQNYKYPLRGVCRILRQERNKKSNRAKETSIIKISSALGNRAQDFELLCSVHYLCYCDLELLDLIYERLYTGCCSFYGITTSDLNLKTENSTSDPAAIFKVNQW